jgi:hypothetical protein
MFDRILDRIDRSRDQFLAKDNSDRVWLLRRGVYFATFLYFALLLPDASRYFGSESLVYGYIRMPHRLEPGFRMLFSETVGPYYLFFILGLFISILIGTWRSYVRVAGLLVYFFAFNLFNRVEYISNGSVTVTYLLLIYLMFMSERNIPNLESNKWSYLNRLITNSAFFIAQLQICTVYLTAGLYKLSGEEWIGGSAFYYTLNFEFLSHKLIANQFFKSDLALYAANYYALGYQVLFPLLVWVKSIKKWLLLTGFILHLGIIVVNGLVDFGLIMMVSYSLFINNDEAKRIRNFTISMFYRIPIFFKKLNTRN